MSKYSIHGQFQEGIDSAIYGERILSAVVVCTDSQHVCVCVCVCVRVCVHAGTCACVNPLSAASKSGVQISDEAQ